MDESLDHIICSSSWTDGDVKERSAWGHSELGLPNVVPSSSLRLCKDDKRDLPMVSANQNVGCLGIQDTATLVLGSEPNYAAHRGISEEAEPQKGRNCNGNIFPNGIIDGNLKVGNMGLQYDTANPTLGLLNLGYPPLVDHLTSLPSTGVGSVACNGSELAQYQGSLNNLKNLSFTPQLWPLSSYDESVSSLYSLVGEDRMPGFGLHGGNSGGDLDIPGNRFVAMEKILQIDNTKGKEDPLFTAVVDPTIATNGMPTLPQNTAVAPAGGCSGAGKPRARARRGQATDPHSIAERLRREKIAERMKNLQELVPNSNKVDKASMLDEIMEYVKFLQLQVKVLSMSRLGSAGAVIPLITDGQTEGSNSLSLSPSAGLGIDISPSPDQIAFEQEVLKLMESNMTAAMQYLQSKGLCLMPTALAAAISNGNATLPGSSSEERKKFFVNLNVNDGSCCRMPDIETRKTCHDSNNMTVKLNRKGITVNCCNGAVKQEEGTLFASGGLKSNT